MAPGVGNCRRRQERLPEGGFLEGRVGRARLHCEAGVPPGGGEGPEERRLPSLHAGICRLCMHSDHLSSSSAESFLHRHGSVVWVPHIGLYTPLEIRNVYFPFLKCDSTSCLA